jgi:uncharacterized membrane protein YuzA (DUF378 family)
LLEIRLVWLFYIVVGLASAICVLVSFPKTE